MQWDVKQVLTRLHPKGEHRKTRVKIDWSGITEHDLYTLARSRILHRMQHEWVRDKHIPEEIEVNATDFIRGHEQEIDWSEYMTKQKNAVQKSFFDDLLKGLSATERAEILKELESLEDEN